MSERSANTLRQRARCVALLYHHVGPECPGSFRDLTIAPEEFERQIAWLARHGYTGIRPSDWLRFVKGEAELPAKPVLITFDDAYTDIVEHALPVLRRYEFGAVVYVVTSLVGGTNAWDERQSYSTLSLMDAEQIRYWRGQGIEFAAHSRTHADLTRLSADQLHDEVRGSRAELEALLGSPVVSFAYPFGAYNDAAVDAVRTEFDLGFSCIEGFNRAETDPSLLRRAYMRPHLAAWEFAFTMRTGGLPRMRELRVRLALRTRVKRALGIRTR